MTHTTVWLIDPQITVVPCPDGSPRPTPADGLTNAGTLINRLAGHLARHGETEGTVLLTDEGAQRVGWTEPVTEQGFQPARAELERHGWKVYQSGDWATCKPADGAPAVHVGLVDALDAHGWTFEHAWWWVTVNALQEWHRLSGHAWANNHPIMGVELIHRTVRPWREPGMKGNLKIVRRDEHTPPGATETPFLPGNWGRPQKGHFRHQYDRYRAGLTASGAAKLAVTELTNGYRRFDGKRAGWWLIEIPAWNMPELPNPAGPHKVGTLQWVTTATMDLMAEMAHEGLLSMPDVRESWTAPARPVLLPFQKLLEGVYRNSSHPLVQGAAKEVADAGIGMLANADGSFYRPDWNAAVNATKRANCWRTAYRVGNACGRYPVAFDDDTLWYPSDLSDPVAAAPDGITLKDVPGGYHPEKTVEQKGN